MVSEVACSNTSLLHSLRQLQQFHSLSIPQCVVSSQWPLQHMKNPPRPKATLEARRTTPSPQKASQTTPPHPIVTRNPMTRAQKLLPSKMIPKTCTHMASDFSVSPEPPSWACFSFPWTRYVVRHASIQPSSDGHVRPSSVQPYPKSQTTSAASPMSHGTALHTS